MTLKKEDYDILKKFNFDRPPIGVKYTFRRPERIERLGDPMALCEMLNKAQEGNAFYGDKNNITCGKWQLGMQDFPPMIESGEFSAALKVFEEPRSGTRLYQHLPRLQKGVINYVSFAPLNELSFDPDVMIFFTNETAQTQTLLRATNYRTAHIWETKFTSVLGCSWILIYPYLSGEMNYGIMGLSHGMGRRKLFPEGLQFVALPYLIMPSVLQALQDMPWVLPSFQPDGADFFNRTRDKLTEELPKHIVE